MNVLLVLSLAGALRGVVVRTRPLAVNGGAAAEVARSMPSLIGGRVCDGSFIVAGSIQCTRQRQGCTSTCTVQTRSCEPVKRVF